MTVADESGRVSAYIEENWARHLEEVRAFVRQPSISADGTGMADCAQGIVRWIERLGGTGEVVPTQGWPVVYGQGGRGRVAHALALWHVRCAADVLGETWLVDDPFGGEIITPSFAPRLGCECLVNRGVTNQKGPLVNTFLALEALKNTLGKLPLNLIFMIEGEEEMGSKHLPDFVAENRARLECGRGLLRLLLARPRRQGADVPRRQGHFVHGVHGAVVAIGAGRRPALCMARTPSGTATPRGG